MDKEKLNKLLQEKVAKFNQLQKETLMTAGEIRLLNHLLKAEVPTPPKEEKKEGEVV